MVTEKRTPHHSDLAPSSKDWQPGSTGRDEDFTPDKDLWTIARKGDIGQGRPGEDIHASPEAQTSVDEVNPSGGEARGSGEEIQPGTQQPGTTWTSDHTPSKEDPEGYDGAVEDTFPASDPTAAQNPATGWIKDDEAVERAGGKRG